MEIRPRILIILLYSNGDCLLATPILSQIRRDFPTAHITWNVASFSKHFLINNPEIDKLNEVNEVVKNDIKSYRKYRYKLEGQARKGIWDKIYYLQLSDSNLANYDGCIRSMLFNSYGEKIETSFIPRIYLTERETKVANDFIDNHKLEEFDNVILFEFAPQSGQLKIDMNEAMEISNEITSLNNIAVIMSSPNKFDSDNPKIIDGSELSIRETGALLKHCNLVLGCSSGLSWMATSNIGNRIPLIQILDTGALWVNPMSRDFEWFNINQPLIELYQFDKNVISDCVKLALVDFEKCKETYQLTLPVSFNTTSATIYNLLCYLQFKSIIRHIYLNFSRFGFNKLLIIAILKGFLFSPFKLCYNLLFKKKVKRIS